ncbi:hypothetical protein K503DRAFT_513110 [Rhizopogon vinicolor AM-OR11-026]|uniref:Transmembrane protein n=1 Tax=Rhizopogon vinicolor AM-OR11-026 TaxID=1314800 RepID=A0A1B7MLV9_9AGAM|nr:hypothetical protein K503DRAFT_513110 [Rhizopogon vinicolor AM-OR11-026]
MVYPERRHDCRVRVRTSRQRLCSTWRLLSPHLSARAVLQQARACRLQLFFSLFSFCLFCFFSSVFCLWLFLARHQVDIRPGIPTSMFLLTANRRAIRVQPLVYIRVQ